MRKLKNIALIILVISTIVIVGCCGFYRYMMMPTDKNSKQIVEIEIPLNSTSRKIASILKENKLIKDEKIFLLYLKIIEANDLKAGYYDLKMDMGVEKIVEELRKGSTKNPNQISITFQEGLHMREIATIISNKTNNTYEEVLEKANDKNYLLTLIENYWLIDESILNEELYYGIEGYLFPNTYLLTNKDVSVEYIFQKMLTEMNNILTPYRETIENSNLSLHNILTLASVVEKESATKQDRDKVASVFINRMKVNMPLGSDVTTRYAFKVDNKKQVLTKVQYNTKNPYNTRVTDGSMNGKLPVGPICNPSKESIEAAINPKDTNYLYFIANIKTLETFFYEKYNDFLNKKDELAAVNGGF